MDIGKNVMGLLHDENEEIKVVLGQNYLQSIITGAGVEKGSVILSDRRIYQVGRAYEKIGRKLTKINRNSTLDIEDVTGVTVETNQLITLPQFLISSVFLLVACIYGFGEVPIYMSLSIGIFSIGMVYLILSPFLKAKKHLIIQYAGGVIALEHSWFPPEEIQEFQKLVFAEKDRIKNEIKNERERANTKDETNKKESYIEELKELANLKDLGVITEEQFELKRSKLLGLE